MKIVKVIVAVLAGLVLLFVGVGFALPQNITVEREIVVKAPAAVVFEQLNSYKNFNTWSPWASRDPKTRYTYTGPESGVGAGMSWKSDHPQVGSGSQEIVKSTPNTYLETALEFGEDEKGEAYFKLVEKGEETNVTWGMRADMGNNPVGRWMGLMMDKWVGTDYQQGLINLKAQIEKKS